MKKILAIKTNSLLESIEIQKILFSNGYTWQDKVRTDIVNSYFQPYILTNFEYENTICFTHNLKYCPNFDEKVDAKVYLRKYKLKKLNEQEL